MESLPDLVESNSAGKCVVCQKDTMQRCVACDKVGYCSADHQKDNWTEHKEQCCPYRILRNEKLGRYVVASRTIEPGEIIMEDRPVAVGPKQDSYPQCLTCYNYVDGMYMCPRCKWPMCGEECANDDAHKGECAVFSATNNYPKIEDWEAVCYAYDCISTLRLLLVKEKNPELWTEVEKMELHTEDRRERDTWKVNQVNVVEFLRGPCKLERFSEEEIHAALGVFEVNSFEAHGKYYSICCVYPFACLFSHSCKNNTQHSIFKDFRIVFRATVRIGKGEEITTSYTSSMYTTQDRRRYIRYSKFFDCECARCRDPVELGAYTSAFKCCKCHPGYVVSTDPLNENAEWKCNNCSYSAKADTIQRVIDMIQRKIDAIDPPNDIIQMEKIIKEYKGVVHPWHSLLIRLKHSLSQLYGRVPGFLLATLPDVLLERKIELCKEVLEIANHLEPGMSRLRGITLYEIHAAIILLAQHQLDFYEINQEEFRQRAKEALMYLREAVVILDFDDPESPEGMMAVVGRQALQQLETFGETLGASKE